MNTNICNDVRHTHKLKEIQEGKKGEIERDRREKGGEGSVREGGKLADRQRGQLRGGTEGEREKKEMGRGEKRGRGERNGREESMRREGEERREVKDRERRMG